MTCLFCVELNKNKRDRFKMPQNHKHHINIFEWQDFGWQSDHSLYVSLSSFFFCLCWRIQQRSAFFIIPYIRLTKFDWTEGKKKILSEIYTFFWLIVATSFHIQSMRTRIPVKNTLIFAFGNWSDCICSFLPLLLRKTYWWENSVYTQKAHVPYLCWLIFPTIC